MKIKNIHIVEGACTHHMDDIHLETDLPIDGPTGKWLDGDEWKVSLDFSVAHGTGVAYCKKYFPKIKRKITNVSKGIWRNKE